MATRQDCWVQALIQSLAKGSSCDTAAYVADQALMAFNKQFPPTEQLHKEANEKWMADCMDAVNGLKVTIPFDDVTGNPVVDVINSMKAVIDLCKEQIIAGNGRPCLNAIQELGL